MKALSVTSIRLVYFVILVVKEQEQERENVKVHPHPLKHKYLGKKHWSVK